MTILLYSGSLSDPGSMFKIFTKSTNSTLFAKSDNFFAFLTLPLSAYIASFSEFLHCLMDPLALKPSQRKIVSFIFVEVLNFLDIFFLFFFWDFLILFMFSL